MRSNEKPAQGRKLKQSTTTPTMRALIVEDDKETVDFVSAGLAEKGFACDSAASGEDGLWKLSAHPYDIAIVDITLEGTMSGLDLIKTARKSGVKTPIIVLSAMNTPADKIDGLNCGADDYLGKPFARNELVARVSAHIRRTSYAQSYDVLKVKDLTLCMETHEVKRGARQINLTTGEYALLELLMRNAKRTIPARMILQSVWDMDYVPSSKIVETRICSLRKKLCAAGEPNVIFTMRGFGYVLR